MSFAPNAFSVVKPYRKHPTSTWFGFSDWLDDKLDLDTAPRQYAFNTMLGLGVFHFILYRYRSNKLRSLVPDGAISSSVRERALQDVRSRTVKWAAATTVVCFTLSSLGSFRRSVEVDRSGDRFREYFVSSRYAGLSDEDAVTLARDVVYRSMTREEGKTLLNLALSHLVQQGVIPRPTYRDDKSLIFGKKYEEQQRLAAEQGRQENVLLNVVQELSDKEQDVKASTV